MHDTEQQASRQSSTSAVVTATAALVVLVRDIRAEHKAAQEHQRQSVDHAIRCGELLLQAKKQVGHGGWTIWLSENVKVSETAARGYMRLAGIDEAKRQRVADLTLREALKSVSNPFLAKPIEQRATRHFRREQQRLPPPPPPPPTAKAVAALVGMPALGPIIAALDAQIKTNGDTHRPEEVAALAEQLEPLLVTLSGGTLRPEFAAIVAELKECGRRHRARASPSQVAQASWNLRKALAASPTAPNAVPVIDDEPKGEPVLVPTAHKSESIQPAPTAKAHVAEADEVQAIIDQIENNVKGEDLGKILFACVRELQKQMKGRPGAPPSKKFDLVLDVLKSLFKAPSDRR